MVIKKTYITFALANHKGTLAEWLGNGLQNRVRRFESARYLKKSRYTTALFFVIFIHKKNYDIEQTDRAICHTKSYGMLFVDNIL